MIGFGHFKFMFLWSITIVWPLALLWIKLYKRDKQLSKKIIIPIFLIFFDFLFLCNEWISFLYALVIKGHINDNINCHCYCWRVWPHVKIYLHAFHVLMNWNNKTKSFQGQVCKVGGVFGCNKYHILALTMMKQKRLYIACY
jgi:hypothetical protein